VRRVGMKVITGYTKEKRSERKTTCLYDSTLFRAQVFTATAGFILKFRI
jgi:hypothetical protein